MIRRILVVLFLAFWTRGNASSITDSEFEQLQKVSQEIHIGIFGKAVPFDFIRDMETQLGGLINLYQFTGTSNYVSDEGFMVFPFRVDRKQKSKEWKASEFKLSELINYLDEGIENFIEKISSDFIQDYMSSKIKQDLNIMFVVFEKDLNKKHLAYRTLANIDSFRKNFKFVQVFGNFDKIQKTFRITKFPALICFFPVEDPSDESDNVLINAFPFQGSMNYKNLHKFVDYVRSDIKNRTFLRNLKRNQKETQEDIEDTPVFDDSIKIQALGEKSDTILQDCENVLCIIGFDNFWVGEEAQFNNTITVLKSIQKKFSKEGLRVILLDGGCHNYLLPELELQLETLPSLIIYSAKKLEFYPLMGKFNEEEIMRFIFKFKRGNYKPIKLNDQISLKDMNCEKEIARLESFKQSRNSNLEDDEIMKEAIERARLAEQERKFFKPKPKKHTEEL